MSEQIFEQVLEERIGFGKHQMCQFLIVSLIDFLNGAEFLYLSFLLPTLKREWNLRLIELIIYGATFNFGLMIGSTICGFLADKIGRKNILVIGTFLQTFLILLTAFSTNIIQMIVLRLTYGIVNGMILPLSSIMMIEVTPKEHRGQIIVALQIVILLGKVWIMIFGYIFMDSISRGNWRAISLYNSIPSLICFLGTLIWIQESPRFLILHDKLQQGLDNLDKIGYFNKKDYYKLNEFEIQFIKEWQQEQMSQHLLESHSITQLFNKDNLPITWKNCTIFFLFMFVMYAVFMVVPFILENENKSLTHIFIIEFGDIPAIFFMFYTIDRFGRLPTLIVSNTILVIILASIWQWQITIMVIGLFIFKFCCKVNWGTLNVLFAESYHTLYRSLGVGITMSVGRIAASIVPFIIYPIHFGNSYLPFLICSGLTFLAGVLLVYYPVDLTKKSLDQLKQSS